MSSRPPRVPIPSPRVLACVIVFIMVAAAIFPSAAKAEIPHENYDLVDSEIDMLVNLLLVVLNSSELALIEMYSEDIDEALENITIADGLLDPATQLLREIEDVAESYENLSRLIPPFNDLNSRMISFLVMEKELIDKRNFIRSFAGQVNLTDNETVSVLSAINRADALLILMNRTIDNMLLSAEDISSLEVDDGLPFANNNLALLIEKLRDLLNSIRLELAELMHDGQGGIQWDKSKPFLTLWTTDEFYILEERIIGGGYLYFNGSFVDDQDIDVRFEELNLSLMSKTHDGQYEFGRNIPINESWLGAHKLQAFTSIDGQNLSSDPLNLIVSLIPTTLSINVDRILMSLNETLVVDFILVDAFNRTVVGGTGNITMDNSSIPYVTDEDGSFQISFSGWDLNIGIHRVRAFYDGGLPFASTISREVEIEVSIPTSVDLNLFSNRLALGYYIVGNGTLMANETEPMANQIVTMFVDGEEIANTTTNSNGIFSFSIESWDIPTGTHLIKAAFLYRDSMWRYSFEIDSMILYVPQPTKEYPFWPFLPGWGGISPPEDFYNLFFGENAYFVWLLMIMTVAIIIKTLQIRKARAKEGESEEDISEFSGQIEEIAVDEKAGEGISAEARQIFEIPSNPNDRIVWYYNQLLAFLRKERKISILDNMTHWEIAGLLKAFGYPLKSIDRATILFEKAFYSGRDLSEAESDGMNEAVERLKSTEETGDTHAT